MRCGLLGRKLGHSYSPQIHRFFGNYPYDLFEKEPQDLESFLKSGDFTALNVTIPYKKDVIPYCSELSPRAARLGAVNTLVRRADGTLIGHNTDFFGFASMITHSGLTLAGKKVLVLGSGGASATVVSVLREQEAFPVVISRSGKNNYTNIARHADAAAIVNATPVGMYPNTGFSPVDLSIFPNLEGVLDLVYNPARTQLLMDAQARGLTACNGLWMLIAQAKEAAEWFTGKQFSNDLLPVIHASLRSQMENIILIGMPGCGKSTVGRLLAQQTGRRFVDADTAITEAAGKPIPEIFSQDGEDAFRTLETQVLTELGKQSGLVLATGGGCVTRACNYAPLHQNGTVFCLERAIHKLPTDGRPLSQSNSPDALYRQRKPLYEQFADHHVDNNATAQDTVAAILKHWEAQE